jgi:hypothetical protein
MARRSGRRCTRVRADCDNKASARDGRVLFTVKCVKHSRSAQPTYTPSYRTKMRVSDQWSAWNTPQFVVQAAQSHDVAFDLLYRTAVCKTNSIPKTTAMRYTLQYLQH